MAADRGPQLAAVNWLFLILAWIFTLLRVYVRLFMSKNFGWDDWALLGALVLFSAYIGCSLMGIKYGTGQHVANLSLQNISNALYFWFLCEMLYALSTMMVRLSIAILLRRLCVNKWHIWIIYGTMATVIAYTLFYFFLILFQCSPIDFFWKQYLGASGTCIDPIVVPNASIAHSAVSAAADWILGALPIFMIWHLNMNVRLKISLGFILSLGLLAGVATVIRIPFIRFLAINDDFLWQTTDVAIWSSVEAGVGIIAAAAATLRPLFKSFINMTSRPTGNVSRSPGRQLPGYIRAEDTSARSRANGSHAIPDVELQHTLRDKYGKHTAEVTVKSPRNSWSVSGSEENINGSDSSQKDVLRDEDDGAAGFKIHKTVEIRRYSHTSAEEPLTSWPR